VARCDAGYALIDGRRVAFDQITHVGGRLQAFVDIQKARPAQRFEAIVVVRSDGARSDAVAFGALVAYEADEPDDEEDGAPRGRLRRHAGASDDEDEAVPESPSAKDGVVAEVSPENAPSPRKKPRRRVAVDDDDEDEEDAPAADAADPLPAPDAPAAAPVPATPPVVTQVAPEAPAAMETEPPVAAAEPAAAQGAPMETERVAPSTPWAPPPRVRPPSSDATALAAAAALAEARSAVDAFRSGEADERLVDDDDTRAARRAGVLRFATAAPRPSTGADRAAASLGLDLLVAAPTPAPVRERHRDALYAARCAVGDDLAPPRLGPEPALDYAPALRAIFGGEAAREATFAGRRFTHYLRDARHSASALAFAYAADDLSSPTN
jgi:hypothetical protein